MSQNYWQMSVRNCGLRLFGLQILCVLCAWVRALSIRKYHQHQHECERPIPSDLGEHSIYVYQARCYVHFSKHWIVNTHTFIEMHCMLYKYTLFAIAFSLFAHNLALVHSRSLAVCHIVARTMIVRAWSMSLALFFRCPSVSLVVFISLVLHFSPLLFRNKHTKLTTKSCGILF